MITKASPRPIAVLEPTALRVVPLEIGRLDSDLEELTGQVGRALLPVPAWLIEHPKGVALFDTGMHRELQHDSSRIAGVFQNTTVDFLPGEELTTRLLAAGHRPSDISHVIISHLHFDHSGALNEIPNARLLVQAEEWKVGFHPRLVEVGLYAPSDFDIGHDRLLLDGEHDVFGDGSVVCIPTPGHTRGHQSLRVKLPNRTIVLTSDCVYFASMLDAMQIPKFGFKGDLQLASMRQLAAMRAEGCELIFGHDIEQFRSLPISGLT